MIDIAWLKEHIGALPHGSPLIPQFGEFLSALETLRSDRERLHADVERLGAELTKAHTEVNNLRASAGAVSEGPSHRDIRKEVAAAHEHDEPHRLRKPRRGSED